MFEIRIDREKNRLHVRCAGFIDDQEAFEGAKETEQALQFLKPGFHVINDISALEELSSVGLRELERVTLIFQKFGVGRVIRVVGRAKTAALQFERVGRELGYAANLAYSHEEAERLLGATPATATAGEGIARGR